MTKTRLALIGNQAFSMLNFRGPLIREMVARGIDVFAFAPDYDDSSRQAVRALGAEPLDHGLVRTGMNPLQDAGAILDLVGKLRALVPDVTLGYSIKPVIYGTLAAWMAGVPRRFAMIEGMGHVFMDNPGLKARALRIAVTSLYQLGLARTARTFFLNEDDRGEFVSLGLVSQQKAIVVGAIGVDLAEWTPAPTVAEPMTFVFVGRLLREKGVQELVEAVRLVKAQYGGVRLVVLGDVDSNPSSFTRHEVEGWIVEGLLEWPGQVEVAPWIAKASVFVLPSYREGVPRATQEAMAMARPVITTDVPGCRDTVVDGRNGFLVPAKDATALAGAMLRFLKDPALVYRMGRESRTIAEERFDVTKANARLLGEMDL